MESVFKVEISSLDELEVFAKEFSGQLNENDVICLSGELGAGKTAFVKKLVKALGGKEEDAASPSFVLQYEYRVGGDKLISHWDLYRTGNAPEDILADYKNYFISIVEWGELDSEILAASNIVIKILQDNSAKRSFIIERRAQ